MPLEEPLSGFVKQPSFKIQNEIKPALKNDDLSVLTNPLVKEYKKIISKIELNIFKPFQNDEKQDILGKAYKIFLKRALSDSTI